MRMHLPGLCLALALGVPSMAGAQGGPRGVELDLNSRYLWRGIPYSDGPVLQPYVWLTVAGTEASVWSSLETGTGPTPWQPNQLFFTLTRTYAKGTWHVAPTLQGYTWRGAPGEPGARTLEVAARVTRPLGAVTFVTVHTVDIASYHGAYVADAGVEHRRVAGPWTGDASADRKSTRLNSSH